MKIMLACYFSDKLRNELRARGHDAWSFDFVRSMEGSPFHIQEDVRLHLNDGWDMMIGFPSCRTVCSSGISWNLTYPERAAQTEEAVEFFRLLLEAPIPRIALENSVGILSTRVRKPDQIVHPWMFGDNKSKRTCLWLKNLPPLVPTNKLPGGERIRRPNQSPCGADNTGTRHRWMRRAITPPGMALAMADQWGGVATEEAA